METYIRYIASAVIGGLLALSAVLFDSIPLLFISLLLPSLATFDATLKQKVVVLVLYYATWFVSMLAHSAIFRSAAVLGLLALVFYAPIMVVGFFLVSYIAGKIVRRFG